MRGKLIVVSTVALAAAVVGVSLAWGSSFGAQRTIVATGLGAGITLVDADANQKPSIGDYEVGLTRYVDPKTGKGMGRGSVVCTQTNAGGTEYQCQGVTHFPGGDVFDAGLFSPISPTSSLAIIGGTGAYAGASGTILVTWLAKDFSKSRTVFSLTD
jgi:hypothetical protein